MENRFSNFWYPMEKAFSGFDTGVQKPKNDFPWGSNDRCPPLAAATTIARWGVTDQAGSFRAEGAFADGTEGNHTLIVEISGIRSNAFSFAVSKCKP